MKFMAVSQGLLLRLAAYQRNWLSLLPRRL